MLKVSLDSRRI